MALLRKVELHPGVRNWSPGRLAANLIHAYRFDGIQYDRCIDTSLGASPLYIDHQSEFPKMGLIWALVNGNRKEMPADILEPSEKCALHWMLSYSVNTTFREEEYFYNIDPPYGPYEPSHPGFPDYQNDMPVSWQDLSLTLLTIDNMSVSRFNLIILVLAILVLWRRTLLITGRIDRISIVTIVVRKVWRHWKWELFGLELDL